MTILNSECSLDDHSPLLFKFETSNSQRLVELQNSQSNIHQNLKRSKDMKKIGRIGCSPLLKSMEISCKRKDTI